MNRLILLVLLLSGCTNGIDSGHWSETRRMEFTVVEVRTIFPYEVVYQHGSYKFQYLSNHCRAVHNLQVGATYASEYIITKDNAGNESIEQLPDICSIAKNGPDPIKYPEVK